MGLASHFKKRRHDLETSRLEITWKTTSTSTKLTSSFRRTRAKAHRSREESPIASCCRQARSSLATHFLFRRLRPVDSSSTNLRRSGLLVAVWSHLPPVVQTASRRMATACRVLTMDVPPRPENLTKLAELLPLLKPRLPSSSRSLCSRRSNQQMADHSHRLPINTKTCLPQLIELTCLR